MNELPSFSDFFASWELFSGAVWSSVLVGMTLGLLGVYIVLGRMVFLTAALSQVAGLGVAFSYFLIATGGGFFAWLSPELGGIAFVFMCLLLAFRLNEQDRVDRDAMLGMLFVAGSAGTLIIGGMIPQEMTDIQSLLFGSAVAVLPEDLLAILVVVTGVLILQFFCWRGFVEIIYDPVTALVQRLPTRRLRWGLLGSLAMMIAMSTHTLGALPTFSFTILPAMFAVKWASNVFRAMLLAALVGAVMGFGGYFLAFRYSFPVGASQTALGLLLVWFGSFLRFGLMKLFPPAASETQQAADSAGQGHHHHHHPHGSTDDSRSETS
ncbi:MAG: metal ABC transporter permease [Deltaproteobacteria bacterium]|jgi:zinc transport system permease protein|nr:metal ABC transporter permease [Deltaproteobacteria bacterium]MBT6435541.1 metal ABC transporter permease [Deltaproteobacteria bacterium]